MKTYLLNPDYIRNHIIDLLCTYIDSDCADIISTSDFQPQSFTVEDKRNNQTLLFCIDGSYSKWIETVIDHQISKTNFSTQDKKQILRDVKANIETLLDFRVNGLSIASTTFYQEFIDIIRRVISYTIYGDTEKILYTAESFNQLADRLMPHVIQKIVNNTIDFKTLFLLSIASGVSGLDLKESPALNAGIAMTQYLNMDESVAATDYLEKLFEAIHSSQTPIFAWNDFISNIKQSQNVVWMTDDYIESHFDLLVISQILEENENIHVEIIPKNGVYGNDLSVTQLEILLNSLFLEKLKPYVNSGRLSVNQYGPRMGAVNIKKLSNAHVQSLRLADILVIKGCRMHEMLQGGLNCNSYSAFNVIRTSNEITTGLNSKESPIVLIHLKPNEYAFWGMVKSDAKMCRLNDGRVITTCASTLYDHERRKTLEDPNEIVTELLTLDSLSQSFVGDSIPLYREIDLLTEKLLASPTKEKGVTVY
jgi:uncharacterized protein with ATP-grasp and redox domains